MSLIFGDNFEDKTDLSNELLKYCFNNNTGLTSAENLILPATTLDSYSYQNMFKGCTSLITAPSILPATTLTLYCYWAMFSGCTSLTTAPELPATTLKKGCYQNMFQSCTSLNYIKMLATNTSASNCLDGWVNNVSASGTFVKASSANLPTGASGIPENWEVINA